jgi:hypothetical protein
MNRGILPNSEKRSELKYAKPWLFRVGIAPAKEKHSVSMNIEIEKVSKHTNWEQRKAQVKMQ